MQAEKTNKDNSHRGRGVWRALLVICILILLYLVFKRLTKPEEEIEAVPLPTVSVTRATEGDLYVETELIGSMQASDIYYVTPKVAGEIEEIYVEQGQEISEGDPICKIDNDKQIDSAKITLDSAQVALNSAQSSLDRMTPLYQAGDVSAQSYEQAQSALQSARLQYEGAKLAYDTQVEYATVLSPVDGVVESESMDLNAMVSQSSQLCVISGDGAKKVSFGVTDRLLSALSQGEPITVTKQGNEYEGTVTEISGMPNAQTGLYEVQATVADNGAIAQGANVQVSFVSDRAEDAVILPMDAVYHDGGKNYVYIFDAVEELNSNTGTVHKVEVETGINDGVNYEIKSGVKADDEVILTWTQQLYEGAQVQLFVTGEDTVATVETDAPTEAFKEASESETAVEEQ
ncbi:MAG: efflux RND transporter periplasmic adaptor subunit [Candidatus Avilachnospira sp.]|jgi:RND family efflux transporter MFP subunit